MPRSGSTLIYNLLRLTIDKGLAGDRSYRYGWVDDLRTAAPADYTLLKLHDFDPQLAASASLIVYSYRDVREAVASMYRKFGTQPTLQLANTYIRQYELWSGVADIKVRYESLDKARQLELIDKVTHLLQMGSVDAAEIVQELDELPDATPADDGTYDVVTLYHPGHITHGGLGNWKTQLEPSLIASIEVQHHEWLRTHDYELTT